MQQAKEDLQAQQNAGKLSLEDAEESQAIREDIGTRLQNIPVPSYQQFLAANKNEDQSALPSWQDYQKYWVEGESPARVVATTPAQAVPAPAAVAEMVAATPKQAPAVRQAQQTQQVQQAQPQRRQPQTIREMIDAMPFAGDRYEAERKVLEGARLEEINRLNAYGDMMSRNGYSMNDVQKFLEIKR